MHAHKFLLVVSVAGIMAVSVNLRADDTPDEAALREALRNSDPTGQFGPVPSPLENYDALIAALRLPPFMTYTPMIEQDYSALIAALRTQPGTTPVSVPPPSVSPKSPAVTTGFAPLQPPALPISATKEQKLNALLVQYKADQITPEQYHTQRAAILAGQ